MRIGLALVLVAGCAGVDLPTAEQLHGTWSAMSGGLKQITFAASDDGSHPELAGLTDVYAITSVDFRVPAQTGTYQIGTMDVPDFGTTDALITSVRSGGATPNPCCWALYGWSGDAFTIDNNTLVEGLTFTRH